MFFFPRLIFIFFSIVFCISLKAQSQVLVKQGEALEPEKNALFKRILGVDAESFYILRIKTRGAGTRYFVERYDKKNFTLKYSSDLLLDDVPGALTDPARFAVNSFAAAGKVYVFFRAFIKDTKERVLFVKSVDKSGTVSGEKEISKIISEGDNVSFQLTVSPDRTKIAIITELRETNSPQDVTVNLYNAANLELIRKVKLQKGYKKGGIYTANYLIDNPGNIYFSFNYLTEKEEVGLALGSIPAKSNELKAVEIIMGQNKELYNGMIKFNSSDNSITLSGLFKDVIVWKGRAKDKPEKKAGVFTFRIGIDKFNIISKSDKYFTPNVYDKLSYAEGLVLEAPGEKYYGAEQILEMDNANYFVACHSYAISNGSSSYSVSRELIVTKISKSGEIEWMKIIPKYTSFKSTAFNTVVVNNKIHFLFLEHPKNSEKFPVVENYIPKDYKAVSGFAGPNAVCVYIDASGKTSKSVFHQNKDFCYLPASEDYLLEENNSLLIRFIKGDTEKFGTVTIK